MGSEMCIRDRSKTADLIKEQMMADLIEDAVAFESCLWAIACARLKYGTVSLVDIKKLSNLDSEQLSLLRESLFTEEKNNERY